MLQGFTMQLKDIDYFFVTSQQKKTKKLAEKVLQKIGYDTNKGNVDYILYHLEKANCEKKALSNGREYYNIFGDNFSGYGGFVDENNTIIINL